MLFFVLVAVEESMRDLGDHVFLNYQAVLEVITALTGAVRNHVACLTFCYSIYRYMDMFEQMLFVGFSYPSKG